MWTMLSVLEASPGLCCLSLARTMRSLPAFEESLGVSIGLRGLRSLAWIPSVYPYLGLLTVIAIRAFLQMVFRRPRARRPTKKEGVTTTDGLGYQLAGRLGYVGGSSGAYTEPSSTRKGS